jgi:hypothetical protein
MSSMKPLPNIATIAAAVTPADRFMQLTSGVSPSLFVFPQKSIHREVTERMI